MTGKEKFEPLDELFRKTFQDLPEKAATSGWDTPSSRVWQRVQSEIKPPATTGWALQTWALLAVLAISGAAGLYYAYNRSHPVIPPVPAPMEQPVASPPVIVPPAEAKPAASSEKTTANPSVKPHTVTTPPHSNPAVNSSSTRQSEPGKVQAAPLPGSGTKPVSPNSTERKKSKNGQEN